MQVDYLEVSVQGFVLIASFSLYLFFIIHVSAITVQTGILIAEKMWQLSDYKEKHTARRGR